MIQKIPIIMHLSLGAAASPILAEISNNKSWQLWHSTIISTPTLHNWQIKLERGEWMFWLNKLWLWRKAFNSHTPNIDWNRWRGNNWAQNNTLFFLLQIYFIQFHSVSLTCMFSICSTSGLRQLLQLKEISFFEDNTVSVSWVTLLTTGRSDTVQLVSDEQVWSLEYIHSFFVKLCDYKFRIHVWTALVNTSYRTAGCFPRHWSSIEI